MGCRSELDLLEVEHHPGEEPRPDVGLMLNSLECIRTVELPEGVRIRKVVRDVVDEATGQLRGFILSARIQEPEESELLPLYPYRPVPVSHGVVVRIVGRERRHAVGSPELVGVGEVLENPVRLLLRRYAGPQRKEANDLLPLQVVRRAVAEVVFIPVDVVVEAGLL